MLSLYNVIETLCNRVHFFSILKLLSQRFDVFYFYVFFFCYINHANHVTYNIKLYNLNNLENISFTKH